MQNLYLAAALQEQADLRASMLADADPDGYNALVVDDLKSEISRRNEGRVEDDLIVPTGTKKDDLVKALEADDSNHTEES